MTACLLSSLSTGLHNLERMCQRLEKDISWQPTQHQAAFIADSLTVYKLQAD